MKMTLAEQLNPGKVRTSGKFTAILAFLLDETWTDPAITEMCITSDGIVMAGNEEDPFMNEMIGRADELDSNLRGLASTCALSPADTDDLLGRVATHVTDWRHA